MNQKILGQFLVGAEVSVFTCVQNGCVDYSASYPSGTGCSFSSSKAARVLSWPLVSIQCWT